MKNEKIKRLNDEHLELLKKEVPNYEWELQSVEQLRRDFDIDCLDKKKYKYNGYEYEPNTDVKWTYKIVQKNKTVDDYKNDVWLKIDYGVELGVEMEFLDRSYSVKQRGYVDSLNTRDKDEYHKKMWEDVREFCDKYHIKDSDRIDRKLDTPRIDSMEYNLVQCYEYEYDQIMINQLIEKNEVWDNQTTYSLILNDFENDIKEKHEEIFGEESNPNGYFGNVTELLKSFINRKVGEVEYYLEQCLEDQVREWEEEREEMGVV